MIIEIKLGVEILNSEKKLNDFSKFKIKNNRIKFIKLFENSFK